MRACVYISIYMQIYLHGRTSTVVRQLASKQEARSWSTAQSRFAAYSNWTSERASGSAAVASVGGGSRHLWKFEVDALGVITISRGCFKRSCSKKETCTYWYNRKTLVQLRSVTRRPMPLRAPALCTLSEAYIYIYIKYLYIYIL